MLRRLLACAASGFALTSAADAASFDCAKASTDIEKAICQDPALDRLDAEMGEAYAALAKRLPKDQAQALKENQKGWLATRRDGCQYGDDVAQCLKDAYVERVAFLEGQPASGPGLTNPLTPRFRFVKQTKTVCGEDIAVVVFGEAAKRPGETAFDAAMTEIGTLAGDEKPEIFEGMAGCESVTSASATYGSPTLIAVRADYYGYYGGAHGNSNAESFVFDLESGKRLAFADLFPDAAKPRLVEACTRSLIEEKRKRYGNAGPDSGLPATDAEILADLKNYEESIAGNVGDFSKWMISDGKVEVYFEPYAIGAYAEGEYACALPIDLLRAATKDGRWITD